MKRLIELALCVSILLSVSMSAFAILSTFWSAPVTVKIGPDFDLSVIPSSQNVSQGGNATYIVIVKSFLNFSQQVQLNVTGSPSGVMISLNPERLTPPPNGSSNSTLTVSANPTATVGNYTLNVTGTDGTRTRWASTNANIVVPEFPSFIIFPLFILTTLLATAICRRKQ